MDEFDETAFQTLWASGIDPATAYEASRLDKPKQLKPAQAPFPQWLRIIMAIVGIGVGVGIGVLFSR